MFTGLHLAGRTLLIPAPVVAEVGYLIAREAGAAVESAFLRSIADGDFEAVDLTRADYARMADLVDQYANLPLGTTDAAVVAAAERLGSQRSPRSTGRTSASSVRATRPPSRSSRDAALPADQSLPSRSVAPQQQPTAIPHLPNSGTYATDRR